MILGEISNITLSERRINTTSTIHCCKRPVICRNPKRRKKRPLVRLCSAPMAHLGPADILESGVQAIVLGRCFYQRPYFFRAFIRKFLQRRMVNIPTRAVCDLCCRGMTRVRHFNGLRSTVTEPTDHEHIFAHRKEREEKTK